MESLFGKVAYPRAYYHCGRCHHGWFPTDAQLRIDQKQTPAARELFTLAGTVHPFAEGAAQVLQRMSGLRVSASTVQRTTEAVGAEIAQHERSTPSADAPPVPWTTDAVCGSGVQSPTQAGSPACRTPFVGRALSPV